MTKSRLVGVAVCASLVFGGCAGAFAQHPTHKHQVRQQIRQQQPIRLTDNGRREYPTQFRIPAHPLVWDCVHVVFPQCDRGPDGLNDGSFR
jgi:hypothetical protein